MTLTMEPVRVRIHITEGQAAALTAVVTQGSPDAELVHLRGFSAIFEMDDPIAWLEARMAEHPRGTFPRASLHAVLRKLSAAIQGQVQVDLGTPDPSGRSAELRLGGEL